MKRSFSMLVLVIALSISTISLLSAQDDKSQSLDQFSSLIGHWRGEGLGGVCEETWLPESGGTMLGTFKLIQNGQVNFFEAMTLSLDSIGPAVRVKHFNADMTAWEDKAEMSTFRYDSTSAGIIYFGGLSFNMNFEDSMKIGVRFKMEDGSHSEKFINCKRVELK